MVPRGGEVPSSRSILRSNLQCGASLVALALLNMSAKSWYSSGIPERSGGGSDEVEAEQSFAKTSDWRCYNSFSSSFCLTILSYSMSTYLEG